jgi:hypothetical protein
MSTRQARRRASSPAPRDEYLEILAGVGECPAGSGLSGPVERRPLSGTGLLGLSGPAQYERGAHRDDRADCRPDQVHPPGGIAAALSYPMTGDSAVTIITDRSMLTEE